jgi:hypothetical protein
MQKQISFFICLLITTCGLAQQSVPYRFTTSYFTYYCNTNFKPAKILQGDETGTWAYVFTGLPGDGILRNFVTLNHLFYETAL